MNRRLNGVLLAAIALCLSPAALGQATKTITGGILADNDWGVFTGNATGQTVHFWQSGSPNNFCHPATITPVTTQDSLIYIAAFSDDTTAQGLLHDLLSNGNGIFSGWAGWEVCATGDDRDTLSQMPTEAELSAWIQTCNEQGLWEPPAIGGANDGSAGYTWWCGGNSIGPIDETARWTWHESLDDSGASLCPDPDSPFAPGCDHGEFLIFRRTLPATEPGADTPCPPAEDFVETLNTALDEINGVTLPIGANDDDWALVSAPNVSPLPQPATVISPQQGWTTSANAGWLGVVSAAVVDTATYRRCFCLNEDHGEVDLDLRLAANQSGELLLNGNSLGLIPGTGGMTPFHADSVADPTLFQSGENCIDVVTQGGAEFIAVGGVAADGGQCCGCDEPPNDMIAWWTLDETNLDPQLDTCAAGSPLAEDIAGSFYGPYDAEHRFVGCTACSPDCQPAAVHDVPGVVGSALIFDGKNDQVRTQATPELAFDDPNTGQTYPGFSIDAWFQRGLEMRLGCDDAAPGWRLWTEPGEVHFWMRDAGGNALTCVGSAAWNDGQWHLVGVAASRTTNWLKIYLDGQDITTTCGDPTTVSGSLDPSNAGMLAWLYMGGYRGCGATADSFRSFKLDEVELFRRTLSQGEFDAIHRAGAAGKCKEECFLPDVGFCAKDQSRNFYAEICNHTADTHDYGYTLSGPVAGPGCTTSGVAPFSFTLASGQVTVAGGDCEQIVVNVANLPHSLTQAQAACFQMETVNLDTGGERSCDGDLHRAPPQHCIKVIDIDAVPILHGKIARVGFEVFNRDDRTAELSYEISSSPARGGGGPGPLSLDGLPPGSSPHGTLSLGGGASEFVWVDVNYTEDRPHMLQRIDFHGDQDADGTTDAYGTIPVLSVSRAPVPQVPDVIGGLTIDSAGISWMATRWVVADYSPSVDGYDIVRGRLNGLALSGGDFGGSGPECLSAGQLSAVFHDPDSYAPGEARYFLVAGTDGAGDGSLDAGSWSQVGQRDADLGGVCP